jgi:hypothetical protein
MNFEIKWDDRAMDRVLAEAKREARRQVEDQLRRVRCPVHRGVPKLRFREVGDQWVWEIVDPCCEKLKEAVDRL